VVKRERIDVLVSFLIGPNIVSIAAARLAGVPIVIGERSAPQTVLSAENPNLRRRGLWSWLVRVMYPRASHIITNTEGAKIGARRLYRRPAARVSVIPNALDLERITSLAAEPPDAGVVWPADPVLVHVGRFTHAKDHETLLQGVREDSPTSTGVAGARRRRRRRSARPRENHRARPRRRRAIHRLHTQSLSLPGASHDLGVDVPVRRPAKRADRIDGVGNSDRVDGVSVRARWRCWATTSTAS
jgi:hypothetical protein